MKHLFKFELFFESKKSKKEEVYVATSTIPNSGKGLFAKKDFKNGDIICEFTGELIDEKEVDKRYKKSKHRASYFIDMGNNVTMDVYNSDCPAKYANDAEGLRKIKGKSNNSEIGISDNKKSAFIVATKKIKADDEVFLRYGKEYWENINDY